MAFSKAIRLIKNTLNNFFKEEKRTKDGSRVGTVESPLNHVIHLYWVGPPNYQDEECTPDGEFIVI